MGELLYNSGKGALARLVGRPDGNLQVGSSTPALHNPSPVSISKA